MMFKCRGTVNNQNAVYFVNLTNMPRAKWELSLLIRRRQEDSQTLTIALGIGKNIRSPLFELNC